MKNHFFLEIIHTWVLFHIKVFVHWRVSGYCNPPSAKHNFLIAQSFTRTSARVTQLFTRTAGESPYFLWLNMGVFEYGLLFPPTKPRVYHFHHFPNGNFFASVDSSGTTAI